MLDILTHGLKKVDHQSGLKDVQSSTSGFSYVGICEKYCLCRKFMIYVTSKGEFYAAVTITLDMFIHIRD
jgi:hypothetical protein